MAGRLTELDLRMANRIEDIIYNQIFTPNVSKNSLFTQLETAKFTVDGNIIIRYTGYSLIKSFDAKYSERIVQHIL